MKHSFKTLLGAAAVASIFAAGNAQAAPATPAEAACHAAIGKAVAGYQATLAKNLVGCHKSRSGGKIPSSTNCNLSTAADLKGGLAGARAKGQAGIDKACTLPDSAAVLALYPRCPSPVATSDDAGATTGIDTFTELGTCLFSLSAAYVDRIGTEVMGAPVLMTPLTKGQQACQGGIGKTLSKYVKTAAGTYTKCQAADEKAGGDLNYDTCAATGDSAGKVNASFLAIGTAITTSCAAANVPNQASFAALGMCGQSTSTLATCGLQRTVKPTVLGLTAAALKFENDGAGNLHCASSADVIINSGHGQKLSSTKLDSGYTGLAHGVDIGDQSLGGVKLQNCNADCENCDVRLDSTNGYCRCENNPTIECGVIEGADVPNCGGSSKCVGGSDEGEVCVTGATCNSGVCGAATCHCMFGPPLALSSGGTPVCVVNRFSEEFTGTTQKVGEYNVGTRTRAIVHLGLSQTVPCPTCTAGLCAGGPRNGKACTADAKSIDFGDTSFDCPPDPGSNVTGAGLNLALAFSSGTATPINAALNVPFAQPGTGPIHCSECTGDTLVGCSSNADCAALGVGTCGVNLGGANPKQNSCTGGAADCVNELCQTGPFDTFCNGAVRQDGGGIIPCATDLDCDTYDSICAGGDCGACSTTTQRKCFNTAITATGTPGIFNSEGVSIFCSAATGNSGVNSAGGLPGAGRVKLDFDFNVWCADHTTRFQLPAGSNCP